MWQFIIVATLLLVSAACGEPVQEAARQKGETGTIPVGKGPDALFLTPDERYLYVANVEDSFISVIDTHKDEVVQTIDSADYPWGFARLGDANLVAVSAWDKGVDVIDFTSHKIVRSKRYDDNLGGIVATEDGQTLFVVAIGAKKILKVDAQTLEIEDEYAVGNGPDGVGLSKNGRKLYVTNTEDGTISVIDVKTGETRLLKVGHKPELIHADHDRSRLFISNFFANKVHILDSDAGKIIHEITGLDGPEEAVLTKSEKILYVVNFNNAKVYAYDGQTYEKLPQEFIVGSQPIGLVHAARQNKLYVSNYGDNAVSAIKLSSDSGNGKTGESEEESVQQEILVKFKAGVEESQVTALTSEVGLRHIKTIPELNLRVFRITSRKSLGEVIAACQKATICGVCRAQSEVRHAKVSSI